MDVCSRPLGGNSRCASIGNFFRLAGRPNDDLLPAASLVFAGDPSRSFRSVGIGGRGHEVRGEGAEQVRGYFGRGADGTPRPGLPERLLLAEAPGALAAIAPLNWVAWGKSQPAIVQLAVSDKSPVELEVSLGELKKQLSLPADGRVRR